MHTTHVHAANGVRRRKLHLSFVGRCSARPGVPAMRTVPTTKPGQIRSVCAAGAPWCWSLSGECHDDDRPTQPTVGQEGADLASRSKRSAITGDLGHQAWYLAASLGSVGGTPAPDEASSW
jgi:hypothetical protein